MPQTSITLRGKTVPVVINMATILAFEEIADMSFFEAKFVRQRERIAIISAAVIAAGKDSVLTIDDILKSDLEEVSKAYQAVMDALLEFLHVPAVVKEAEEREAAPAAEGEKPKN